MARARNIKPGFFSNEDLAECSFPARLCFAGMWTLADREGRLEDRPKRIKGELFRFDSVDVEPLLQELAKYGFILRYRDKAGLGIIQVLEFRKHQTPHFKEGPSILASPQSLGLLSDACEQSPGLSGDQYEEKPQASPGLGGQDSHFDEGSAAPDSLIPDTGYLIPDSGGNTSTPVGVDRARRADDPQLSLVEGGKPKPWTPPDCPHLAVLALWAEVLPALPQHDAAQWKAARSDHLRARWRETAEEKRWPDQAAGLAFFRKLFAYVGKSPFLTGRAPTRGDRRPFFVELEWLIKPSNWAKLIEGKYHSEAA